MMTRRGREIKEIRRENLKDFLRVYPVFKGYPYYQFWDEDMMKDVFEELIENGHIYGYYINGRCVGIIAYRQMLTQDNHPVDFDWKKTAYLAEIAVLEGFRKHGAGTSLMQHALSEMKKEGYVHTYMRTLKEKSMSCGIATEQGFKIIKGVVSIDTSKKLNGEEEEEMNIFLEREL